MATLTEAEKKIIAAVAAGIPRKTVAGYNAAQAHLDSWPAMMKKKYGAEVGLQVDGHGKASKEELADYGARRQHVLEERARLLGNIADAARKAGLEPGALNEKGTGGISLGDYVKELVGVQEDKLRPLYDSKAANQTLQASGLLKSRLGADIATGSLRARPKALTPHN